MSDDRHNQNHAETGTVSRRSFLEGVGAVGLSTALAGPMLAGPADAQTAEMPKRGGHLILGVDGAGATTSLDPALIAGKYPNVAALLYYNTLTEVAEDLTLRSQLAESWEARKGATEWVFKLRKGVNFHNGKSLTPADVLYSIDHCRKTSPAMSFILSQVVEMKETAPNEVTFVLAGGNADFPFVLSDYHICIGQEGANFKDGVGTGGYIFESYEPGVRLLAKRNPNYWRSDRAFVDSVELLGINDANARLSALQSGAIHLMNRVDPRAVALLKKNPQINVFNSPSGGSYALCLGCDTAPFNNKDLRLALKYALDREQILKTILQGYGSIGNDQPIPPINPYYAADIPQRPFDIDQAKFHFKKSGYDGPVIAQVADVAFPGCIDATQIFQAGAVKAGMDFQVKRVPSDSYFTEISMKAPFYADYISGRPTADIILTIGYASDALWNGRHWKRPEFDKLLVQARSELDTTKRKQMYHDLQFMIYDDCGVLIPVFFDDLDAGSAKLRGFKPSAANSLSGFRSPEMVWFA